MPFVWSIGTILGPCIGGTFADPAESWPEMFPRDGIFGHFPYLLPNLICALLLFISILLGFFMLEETHPGMQPRVLLPADTYVSDETPLIETSDAMKRPAVDYVQRLMEPFESPAINTRKPLSGKKSHSFPFLYGTSVLSASLSPSVFLPTTP